MFGSLPKWTNEISSSAKGNPLLTAGTAVNPFFVAGTGGMLLDQYWNYKNYELQKEQYEYSKDIQSQMFGREDNAIQRRAADLKAAGLSKTLAAGSAAGAGPVVSTVAPQMKSDITEKAAAVAALLKMQQDISMSQKQMELTDAQIRQVDNTIKNENGIFPSRIREIDSAIRRNNASAYNAIQTGNRTGYQTDVDKDRNISGRSPAANGLFDVITGARNLGIRLGDGIAEALGLQRRPTDKRGGSNRSR